MNRVPIVYFVGFFAGVFGAITRQLTNHWSAFLIWVFLGLVISYLFNKDVFRLLPHNPKPAPRPARGAYAEYLARKQEKKKLKALNRQQKKR